MAIRILLVDDHRIIRQGLRSLLGQEADFEVVGDADNGREAVEAVQNLSPDVVVMDVSMPEMNGIEAARRMMVERGSVKIIGLSMHSDRRLVIEMLRAGAMGYLLKDAPIDEIERAIRTVHEGRKYLSPTVADAVLEAYLREPAGTLGASASAYDALTPREREILQLLSEGKATKEVAMCLKVSVKTVETHRRQIMNKLELYSVAELTKYAIREGLTTVELTAGQV